MKNSLLLPILALMFLGTQAFANIRLLRVDPFADEISIKNFGTSTVDISNYRLCSKFSYTPNLTSLTVLEGSLTLVAGAEVKLTGFAIDNTAADVGLYLPTGSFGSTTAMVDFTQYGSGGNGRESVAVAKGIWSTGDFISVAHPYLYIGDGAQNGVTFWVTDVTPLVINEIDYDQPGVDDADFVELYNNSTFSIDLSGYDLRMVNGSGGGASVFQTVSLPSVMLAPGDYYVVCMVGSSVPNCDLDALTKVENGSPDAVGLVLGGTVVDAVSYEGDSGAPYLEGSGSGLEDDGSITTGSIGRFPDGKDTDSNNNDLIATCATPGEPNSTTTMDGEEFHAACEGSGFFITVNGTVYDETNPSGIETLASVGGCDSIVFIDITFYPESFGSETYAGCIGDGYSVNVNGTTYNEANPSGTELLINMFGCDSTVTVNLTFTSCCSDGILNGDELAVDCGGSCGPCDCDELPAVLFDNSIDMQSVACKRLYFGGRGCE